MTLTPGWLHRSSMVIEVSLAVPAGNANACSVFLNGHLFFVISIMDIENVTMVVVSPNFLRHGQL